MAPKASARLGGPGAETTNTTNKNDQDCTTTDCQVEDPIEKAAARFAKLGFEVSASELAQNFKPEEYDRNCFYG